MRTTAVLGAWMVTVAAAGLGCELHAGPAAPAVQAAVRVEPGEYARLYRSPYVIQLRLAFDAYVRGQRGTDGLSPLAEQDLAKVNTEYFRSKFVVLQIGARTALGVTPVTLVFADKPDRMFTAWLYGPALDTSVPDEASARALISLRTFEERASLTPAEREALRPLLADRAHMG